MELTKIQKILKEKANKKTVLSLERFICPKEKFYGVKIPILNKIAKEIKEPSFELIEKLWKSSIFEEKLLAAKILGRMDKKDAAKTLHLIKKFSNGISNWAICDTVATQGIRKIAREKQREIFALAGKLICSKNFWQRRLAIVLLVELNRQGFDKQKIQKLLQKAENDKEKYVQKAVIWLKNTLK